MLQRDQTVLWPSPLTPHWADLRIVNEQQGLKGDDLGMKYLKSPGNQATNSIHVQD
jgi:hypothetical protein